MASEPNRSRPFGEGEFLVLLQGTGKLDPVEYAVYVAVPQGDDCDRIARAACAAAPAGSDFSIRDKGDPSESNDVELCLRISGVSLPEEAISRALEIYALGRREAGLKPRPSRPRRRWASRRACKKSSQVRSSCSRAWVAASQRRSRLNTGAAALYSGSPRRRGYATGPRDQSAAPHRKDLHVQPYPPQAWDRGDHPRRCPRALRRSGRAQAAPVNLATVSPFVVLGGTTVTNTGPSVLNGDLGVSPGTALDRLRPARRGQRRHPRKRRRRRPGAARSHQRLQRRGRPAGRCRRRPLGHGPRQQDTGSRRLPLHLSACSPAR